MLNPWKIKSVSKAPKALKTAVDLTFVPSTNYKNYSNKIIVNTRMDIVYGSFEGMVTLENEEKVEISGVVGFMERMRARW